MSDSLSSQLPKASLAGQASISSRWTLAWKDERSAVLRSRRLVASMALTPTRSLSLGQRLGQEAALFGLQLLRADHVRLGLGQPVDQAVQAPGAGLLPARQVAWRGPNPLGVNETLYRTMEWE